MAKIDISSLNLKALKALKEKIEVRMVEIEETEKSAFIEKMREEAEARGFDFDDMIRIKKQRKKVMVKAKYQNPNDKKLTWSGRGRKPKWLAEEMTKGRKLDDFLI